MNGRSRCGRSAHFLALFLGAVVASMAPRARADTSATAQAIAIQLFDEGHALMEAEHYADACPKLAESHRLDPQLGVLLYLAQCYEKNTQLASAWGSYRQAEELAAKRGDPRLPVATERAEALEPRLSRLVFELPPGERPQGYRLRRGDMVIAAALWDTAVPIDEGVYEIVASAPGHTPWSGEVTVRGEGRRVIVRVPPLEPATVAPPAMALDAGTRPMGAQRVGALAVGGLGLVGLAVGGYFGLSASQNDSDSDAECNSSNVCTELGVRLREDAISDARISTVATVVGAAAVITGVVLWLSASDASAAAPEQAVAFTVTPKSVALNLTGAF